MGSLPNFFLTGAPKAGTTRLYADLRQHPAVCMSEPKETWYFFDHRKYERGLDWYASQFFEQCEGHRAVGEATPGYMAHPESPRRIAESLEVEPQFLFLLRDPVERAFSHYHFDLQRGARDPSRSFSEVIRDPDEQSADSSQNHVGLVELGCYLQHLVAFQACESSSSDCARLERDGRRQNADGGSPTLNGGPGPEPCEGHPARSVKRLQPAVGRPSRQYALGQLTVANCDPAFETLRAVFRS